MSEYIKRDALIKALDDHKSKVNWDILETHTNTLIAFVIQENPPPTLRMSCMRSGNSTDYMRETDGISALIAQTRSDSHSRINTALDAAH